MAKAIFHFLDSGDLCFAVQGDWRLWAISKSHGKAQIEFDNVDDHDLGLNRLQQLDLSKVDFLDTAGAVEILLALERNGADLTKLPQIVANQVDFENLIRDVHQLWQGKATEAYHIPGLLRLFNRAGQGLFAIARETTAYAAFLGATIVNILTVLSNPWKMRWTSLFHFMEETGINAMPIVATLSFFVGAVLVFLGANLLSQFGFEFLTVQLLGIAMLREFGVIIMAILMAGRSDSAFTAQIGAMKMREEIDAMQVMGLNPMQVLVVPRILAIVLISPLLAFISMMAGLFGGFCVIWFILGISPEQFFAQFSDNVDVIHFWAGMIKAPVFAFLVGITGCRHGLQVGGDVQSLGRKTTHSVVESIFLVIVFEAIFALAYLELGI